MTTKEQTRTAAKKRRERENVEYSKLCKLLPLPTIITDQLDKASVIRLVITYLNLKQCLYNLVMIYPAPPESFGDFEDMGSSLVLGLHGFLLTLKTDGTILYVSEAVSVYLGYSQTDIVGNKVTKFIHPSDALSLSAELRRIIGRTNPSNNERKTEIEFLIRFKTTLSKRNVGISFKFDNSEYKVVHFQGFCCESSASSETTPIVHGLATTLTFPCFLSTDMKLTSDCFVLHLSVDFKIVGFEEFKSDSSFYRGSFYEFVHPADLETMKEAHSRAFYVGQSSTKYYRFLVEGGKFFWVVSYVSSTHFSANENKQENYSSNQVPFFIALTHFLSQANGVL